MNCRPATLKSLAACVLSLFLVSTTMAQTSGTPAASKDILIKNAVLLTVTHGKIANGSLYVKNGKIAAFGENVSAWDRRSAFAHGIA
jgi:adenine deaminase